MKKVVVYVKTRIELCIEDENANVEDVVNDLSYDYDLEDPDVGFIVETEMVSSEWQVED